MVDWAGSKGMIDSLTVLFQAAAVIAVLVIAVVVWEMVERRGKVPKKSREKKEKGDGQEKG